MTKDPFDDIRHQWQDMTVKVDRLEEANRQLSEKLAESNISSSQNRLAKSALRTMFIGLLLPLLAPMLINICHSPVWVCVVYGAFGLIMALFHFILWKYISHKNLATLPTAEALTRAIKIKLSQTRIRLFGIICGLFVLCAFVATLPDINDPYVLWAVIIGAIIGICISVPRAISTHRLARNIISDLK